MLEPGEVEKSYEKSDMLERRASVGKSAGGGAAPELRELPAYTVHCGNGKSGCFVPPRNAGYAITLGAGGGSPEEREIVILRNEIERLKTELADAKRVYGDPTSSREQLLVKWEAEIKELDCIIPALEAIQSAIDMSRTTHEDFYACEATEQLQKLIARVKEITQ